MREPEGQEQAALIADLAAVLAQWAPGAAPDEVHLWARYLLRSLQQDYQSAGRPYGDSQAGLLRWFSETIHERER